MVFHNSREIHFFFGSTFFSSLLLVCREEPYTSTHRIQWIFFNFGSLFLYMAIYKIHFWVERETENNADTLLFCLVVVNGFPLVFSFVWSRSVCFNTHTWKCVCSLLILSLLSTSCCDFDFCVSHFYGLGGGLLFLLVDIGLDCCWISWRIYFYFFLCGFWGVFGVIVVDLVAWIILLWKLINCCILGNSG